MGEGQSVQLFGVASTGQGNNFSRPEGQNVGNFLGARPSSRVLAAPGGASNISLGGEPPAGSVPAASEPEPVLMEKPPPVETPATQQSDKASFLSAMTAKIAGNAGAPLAATPAPMKTTAAPAPPTTQVGLPCLVGRPMKP